MKSKCRYYAKIFDNDSCFYMAWKNMSDACGYSLCPYVKWGWDECKMSEVISLNV